MLYNITEVEVINSVAPHPPFVTEYSVVGDDGTIFLRTNSEDKARARHNQMTILADIREL